MVYLLADRFTRNEVLWVLTLKECYEMEHCAYIASRTPVKFIGAPDVMTDALSVFRRKPKR